MKATEISAAKSRRFFYAAFATPAEANAAVTKLTGLDFGGRTLTAELSKPPKSEEERTAQREARDQARAARKAAAPAPAAAAGGAGAAAPATEKRFFDKRVVVRPGSDTTTLQAEALEKIFGSEWKEEGKRKKKERGEREGVGLPPLTATTMIDAQTAFGQAL